MAKHRSYRLLCPIARALDRLGDRWTLLILRDLHAGPARFSDLQQGLPGLASNLLTTRLDAMQEDGLIERAETRHGAMVYQLTAQGEQTAPVLFELARFGSRWAPPEAPRRPGNLRTVVVTLKEALRRLAALEPQLDIDVELNIDGETFAIAVGEGQAAVEYGAAPDARLSLHTDYDAMLAVSEGRMPPSEFAREHLEVARGGKRGAQAFLSALGRAFAA